MQKLAMKGPSVQDVSFCPGSKASKFPANVINVQTDPLPRGVQPAVAA